MKREQLINWLNVNVNFNDWNNLTDDVLPESAFQAGWMVVPSGDAPRHFKLMGTNETIDRSDVLPPTANYDFSTSSGMVDWLRNNTTFDTWGNFIGYNLPEGSDNYGWYTWFNSLTGLMEVTSNDLAVTIARSTVFPPKADLGDVEQFIINNPELAEVARENSPIEPENSGGSCDYYRVMIDRPTTEIQPSYTAECNDVIEALNMTYAEANIFKEIWRSAAARTLGKKKAGHSEVRGAEKIVFFANRNMIQKGK